MPVRPIFALPMTLGRLMGPAPTHATPPTQRPNPFQVGTSGNDSLTADATHSGVLGQDGNDTLVGGAGDDHLFGGRGDDQESGGDGNDVLFGGPGADKLNGGAGNDTLGAGWDADTLTGGSGNDAFLVFGKLPATAAGLERVTDWTHGQDHLVFGPRDVATAANFATATAGDFSAATTAANAKIAAGSADYVAVQVGADVIVFADSHHNNGTADAAVLLVGRTLADVTFGDIH